jgi:cytochrome b
MVTVRIWDLPTRLFHWLLVLCVLGLVVTGQMGGNAMLWHFRLGYAVLSLLVFRLVWGFVGGHWSRWRQLPLRLRLAMDYLRNRQTAGTWAGHNPIGSWSVLLMLSWLLLQVGTGLVSDDEISNSGPLSALVSSATVSAATAWHKGPGKLVLFALVLLHILAIAWYQRRKGQALLPAMWHGDKTLPTTASASLDNVRARLLALALWLACAVGVAWLVTLGGN